MGILSDLKLPTPKTLDEAVQHAVCIGPMRDIPERTYHVMRDFMAQKFSVAIFKVNGNREAEKVLFDLFEALTVRPFEQKENTGQLEFPGLYPNHGGQNVGESEKRKNRPDQSQGDGKRTKSPTE